MAITRSFAYNSGTGITGTTQYGSIAVGTLPINYGGGVRWWNGPDESLGYVIGHTAGAKTTGNKTVSVSPPTIGFWRSSALTENSFVSKCNLVLGQNFTDGATAKSWLESNGYWTSYPGIVTSNLLVHLDSGNPSSYPGTGSTWYGLTGGNATLFNTPTYSSTAGGILSFDDASLEYATVPNIGNVTNWTVEAWFRLTSAIGTKVTSIVCNQYDLVSKLNFSIGTNNAPSNYNIAVGFYNGAWRTNSGFTPSTNTWYQVVGTYDGTTIRQFVNGATSGGILTYTGTPQSGGEVRLMRRWDDSLTASNLADGDLAIVRIYNTALNFSQVLQNFNSQKSRFGL
jgi:hypothetical protein